MSPRIKPQMVVANAEGRIGVAVPDFMSFCLPEETPVVWQNESGFLGVPTDQLTVVRPEDAQADPKTCGAGKGSDCCICMTVGPDGFSCERHSSMRYSLILRKSEMNAKREPTALYPFCQNQG